MICVGFGHRNCSIGDEEREKLNNVILELINKGYDNFFCGDNGAFDRCFASVVNGYRDKGVKLSLVLAYYNNKLDEDTKKTYDKLFDETIYPPLEEVPKKWAISHRNRWMVDKADFVIFYINHCWGGAYATYKYAKQRHKSILNLGSLTEKDI